MLGEISSSGRATLYKNPSDLTVIYEVLIQGVIEYLKKLLFKKNTALLESLLVNSNRAIKTVRFCKTRNKTALL